MVESAAGLVDHVLPHVPIRQWVLSFPWPLRLLFAARPELLTRQRLPADEFRVQHVKHRVRRQHVQHPAGSVEIERLRLAQVQLAGDVIHVGVGQHHRVDGAAAKSRLRL